MNHKGLLAGHSSILVIAAASLAMPAVAHAQVQEIVVTAQKRAENVQDVPIAIQAFDGDALEEQGISEASDITNLAPNLNISATNPVNKAINIRGVGTNDFFGNATGSVGVYMDEVTMSAPYLTGLGLYDIERVEVLRGPQNSLFGRNTTGGAVNYISRMPELGLSSPEGYVRGVFGRFDRFEVETGLTVPIADPVALRIAGKYYTRNGIWNNLASGDQSYGDQERISLRANLVFEPTPATRITVNGHYANEDSQVPPNRFVGLRAQNGSPQLYTIQPGPVPAVNPANGELDFERRYDTFNAQGFNVSSDSWQDIYRVGNDEHKIDALGFFLKVEHEFDSGTTLTSITSYDETKVRFTNDLGGPGAGGSGITMINGQDQDYEQFSQELRLASSSTDRFRWVAGLYYFKEDSTLGQNMGFGDFAFDVTQPLTVPGAPPFPGQPVGGSFGLFALIGAASPPNANGYGNQAGFSIAELSNDVYSPYLHTEFEVSDRLTLTLGARYTRDEKTASIYVGNVDTSMLADDAFRSNEVIQTLASGNPACDFDNDGNLTGGTPDNRGLPCQQTLNPNPLTFDEWGGKIGLDFQANDDVLVYASYSRGFRSGKFDIEFFHGPQTGFIRQDVGVEKLDAFELGLKSTIFGQTLQLNASAFYYIWKDQQIFDVDPLTGPTFLNLDESVLYGVELELLFQPDPSLTIQGGIGLLDTEVTDKGSDPFNLIENGHELPFAANFSANGLVRKKLYLGSDTLTLQTDFSYTGESFTKLRNVPFNNTYDSRFLLNARVSYSFDDQFEIAGFMQNITAEKFCQVEQDLFAFSGISWCTPNEGRAMWGIEGKIRF